jgi:hypothetical protein
MVWRKHVRHYLPRFCVQVRARWKPPLRTGMRWCRQGALLYRHTQVSWLWSRHMRARSTTMSCVFFPLQVTCHIFVVSYVIVWQVVFTESMPMTASVLRKRWWVPLWAACRVFNVEPSFRLMVKLLRPSMRCWRASRWSVVESLRAWRAMLTVVRWCVHFRVVPALLLLLKLVDLLLDEIIRPLQICIHDPESGWDVFLIILTRNGSLKWGCSKSHQ